MRPDYELIADLNEQWFITKKIERNNRPSLSTAWHYHPEVEICYTKKSNGKRYVGNNISDYYQYDLVMLGSNLPHGFTTDEKTSQVVIQFKEDFFAGLLKNQGDALLVNSLFERAKMGLEFKGETNVKAGKIIGSLMKDHGIKRLIRLLRLIEVLSKSEESDTICSNNFTTSGKLNQLSRIRTIFEFVENNYNRDITVEEAADLINMTESSFYKFIKRHTKKRFTQLVNQYRLEHASKDLVNSRKTIAQICFASGFKNISYFNRKFKEVHGKTPGEFRKIYR